jgi:hypothetical protein
MGKPSKFWVEYNKPWLDFEDEGLARAGTFVEVKGDENDAEAVEKYLIGDINEARGVCDDCTAFPKGAIVLRYKELVNGEMMTG